MTVRHWRLDAGCVRRGAAGGPLGRWQVDEQWASSHGPDGLLPLVAIGTTPEAVVEDDGPAGAQQLRKLRPYGFDRGGLALERCALVAERMNEFLHRYRERGWVKGAITINDGDLTFYVGTRPWDQALGAETKVLFFLAYSYATLFLASDLDEEAAFPGLLLVDNPYQQGIDTAVVDNVLRDLATAARATGTQIISTQAVPVPRDSATIREIHMPREYETP